MERFSQIFSGIYRGFVRNRKRRGPGKSDAWFRGLLESAPDAMVITDEKGIIMMVNAQAENLFGFNRKEMLGKPVELLIPGRFNKAHEKHVRKYVDHPKVRTMGEGMELFGRRKDGSEFSVAVSLSPLHIDGEGINVIAAIRDISKQIEDREAIRRLNENLEQLVQERTNELSALNAELETRVLKRTWELEETNKELEAFSYSVSHDLRAPLRSIDGFSNKLVHDYGRMMDEQGKDYFSRVIMASQKMGHLIDDLLKLARLSRVELVLETTDLSALAEAIADDLKNADLKRKAQFSIQQGMIARVDRNLMQIALQNLLDNAWKYSRNNEYTEISFRSFIENDHVIYKISDNGVGFDMKYAEKLFGAFQRLHGAAEFEGTGIGLATVKRIIRRHHGRIWAEGYVNQGASFYFTLLNEYYEES
jgi:PAS domain S-box-containing protein